MGIVQSVHPEYGQNQARRRACLPLPSAEELSEAGFKDLLGRSNAPFIEVMFPVYWPNASLTLEMVHYPPPCYSATGYKRVHWTHKLFEQESESA